MNERHSFRLRDELSHLLPTTDTLIVEVDPDDGNRFVTFSMWRNGDIPMICRGVRNADIPGLVRNVENRVRELLWDEPDDAGPWVVDIEPLHRRRRPRLNVDGWL